MTEKLTEEEYRLVHENIALAKFLYKKYLTKFQRRADYGIDPNDLLSQAYYGLVRAAKRYRAYGEERGYSEESIASGQYFSVFARKSIIGQMLDSLRKLDHVHTLVRKDFKVLQAQGLGATNLSEEELAEASGMSVERLRTVVKQVQSKPVHLYETVGADSEQTVGDTITSEGATVEATALESSLRQTLHDTYLNLDGLSRVVIALKYVEGEELPEIARQLGRSLTEVRRAHTDALLTIHEAWHNQVTESSEDNYDRSADAD